MKYLNLEHNNITSVPHLRLLDAKSNVLLNRSHLTSHTPTANLSEVIDEEIEDVNSKISILEEILYNSKTDGLGERYNVIEAQPGTYTHRHLQGNEEYA